MKRPSPSPDIPFDLVISILTRVPAKSLMRFKSVSKIWSSLICSKYFTDRFLELSSSPPRLYICLFFFQNSNLKALLLSSPYNSDDSFDTYQDLTFPLRRITKRCVSHVFRGLMCLVNMQNTAHIYNTTTRQYVVLPDILGSDIIADQDHRRKSIMYTIGHDVVHDRYKVICTAVRYTRRDRKDGESESMTEHWVLLLGGDESCRWRKIPSQCPSHQPTCQGLTINGRMHYFAVLLDLNLELVLVSIDINSEEITMLHVNEVAVKMYWSKPTHADLIEYHGKVAVLSHRNLKDQGQFELWVLEDAKNNRWSIKTWNLHASQMHLVNSIGLRLGGTTRNGEVIIFVHEDKTLFYVLLYDIEKNHMRKLEIKGTPYRHLAEFCEVVFGLDDIENLMYITT